MSKPRPTTFKKGQSGNKAGRPVGIVNSAKAARAEFEKTAEEDISVAYTQLKSFMAGGESWAHSIFWKDVLPKKKIVAVVDSSIANRLIGLLSCLPQFEQLTHEQVISEIMAHSSVKLAAKMEDVKASESQELKDGFLEKVSLYINDKLKANAEVQE